MAFKTHPEVVSLKDEIKALESKKNALQQKISRFLNDDPDDEAIKRELLYDKEQAEIDIAYLNNKIITSYDAEKKILYYKKLLKPFKKSISNLEDFPIDELFNHVVIKNRNKVSFGIAFDLERTKKPVDSFHKIKTSYLIRKTERKLDSQIDLY